ncbi:MAG: hypothetical protein FWE55_04260, partial [Synergistaceae bacterium]|nr:hypothetical protein [Synergistaceae bacterium]
RNKVYLIEYPIRMYPAARNRADARITGAGAGEAAGAGRKLRKAMPREKQGSARTDQGRRRSSMRQAPDRPLRVNGLSDRAAGAGVQNATRVRPRVDSGPKFEVMVWLYSAD